MAIPITHAHRLLLLLMVHLFAAGVGRATPVAAHFCVDYTALSYNDGLIGDWHTGTSMPAWGALLRFYPNSGGFFGIYLDDNDESSPGCGWVLLDTTETYAVKLVSKAQLETNLIELTTQVGGGLYLYTFDASYQTSDGLDTAYELPATGSQWKVMAAASRAVGRRDGGLENQTFAIFNTACPFYGACYDASEPGVFLDSVSRDQKFVIAHELGHMLQSAKNGWNANAVDYDAAGNDCPSSSGMWRMGSKEYNSAAATEGFANFYAAMAFNNDSQAGIDCEYFGSVDWDQDGTSADDNPAYWSCETGWATFDDPPYTIPGNDYFADKCDDAGITSNRGTAFDWLRMFWDLRTDGQVGVPDIFEIMDKANPHSWNESGNGTGGNYPSARMSDAAFDVGGGSLQTNYDNKAAFNGADR